MSLPNLFMLDPRRMTPSPAPSDDFSPARELESYKISTSDQPWRLFDFETSKTITNRVVSEMYGNELNLEAMEDEGHDNQPHKLPRGPIYLIDGSNVFFDNATDGTKRNLERDMRTALSNQGGRQLPTVVVWKKEGLPKTKAQLDYVLSHLKHFVPNQKQDTNGRKLPNLFFVAVDIQRCQYEKSDKCMEVKRLQDTSVCTYRHQTVPLTDSPGGFYKVQQDVESALSHLFCEYDDVLLSALFWHATNEDDRENVEVVSNDRSMLKSREVVSHVFKEIKGMALPSSQENSNPVVNFTTQYYNLSITPSTDKERTRFVSGAKRTNWGFRNEPPPLYIPREKRVRAPTPSTPLTPNSGPLPERLRNLFGPSPPPTPSPSTKPPPKRANSFTDTD